MAYKFLEHTADVKIHAEGATLERTFSECALALREIVLRHEKLNIKEKILKNINVEGKDACALLYNFLEEFIYLLDAEDFIFSKIEKIKIKDGKLTAEITGDKASNYKISNEVKAITYNEMKVQKIKLDGKNNYLIEFVVDV